MARKKKQEEPENHERWLVSYADFITLLFAFFTTMYAISTVDAQKMGRMVLSMQAAFEASIFPTGSSRLSLSPPSSAGGNAISLIDGIAPMSPDAISRKRRSQKKVIGTVQPQAGKFLKAKQKLERMIQEKHLLGKLRLIMSKRGLIIRLAEVGFFESGSGSVKPQSLPVIDELASQLKGLNHLIRVEGHTDNVPIRTSRYRSNWELSTARATNIVIRFQIRHGIDPQRLSASGYGEYRPLKPNDSKVNRALNRRVDIILLNEASSRDEPVSSLNPPKQAKVDQPPTAAPPADQADPP